MQEEKNKLNEHLTHLTDDLISLKKNLSDKEDALQSVQRNMDLEINEQQLIKNEILNLNNTLNNYQIELAEMKEQEKAISGEMSLVKRLINNIEEKIRIIDDETNVVREKLEQVTKDIENDRKMEQMVESDLNHVTLELNKNKELIYSNQQTMKQLLNDRETVIGRTEEIKEVIHQYEIKESKIDWQMQQLMNKLNEQHAVNLTQARIWIKNNPMNGVKMSDLNGYKNEMISLGDVHIGALEEYKRIKERYDFLVQQQNDLLESKESLKHIITDLEDHMKSRFEEQFQKIQHKFNEVFQKLFHGGSTQLILQNPEDLLTSGIDIIAQPPGKKSQHLSLLSGGEKALTAIALLFGILLVKPSPFCVLDEIEAALDDANVSRFADYLISLSENIQFIIVTHKKETMERADTLYGITMQEKGISKLLTLKLQEIDQSMIAG